MKTVKELKTLLNTFKQDFPLTPFSIITSWLGFEGNLEMSSEFSNTPQTSGVFETKLSQDWDGEYEATVLKGYVEWWTTSGHHIKISPIEEAIFIGTDESRNFYKIVKITARSLGWAIITKKFD